MWASIALMWACLRAFPAPVSMAPFSDFFVSVFSNRLEIRDLIANVTLWGSRVNPVTWSMYVEAIGSAYIPVSLLLSARFGRRADWCLLVISLIIAMSPRLPEHTFHYIVCFQSGVILANIRNTRKPMLDAIPPGTAFGTAISIFVFPRLIMPSMPTALMLILNTCASVMLINAATRDSADRILRMAPFRIVGRVSYSLYLLHLPVLYATGLLAGAFGITGPGLLPPLVILVVCLSCSLALAVIGFVLVERPSIAMGRSLSEAIKKVCLRRRSQAKTML